MTADDNIAIEKGSKVTNTKYDMLQSVGDPHKVLGLLSPEELESIIKLNQICKEKTQALGPGLSSDKEQEFYVSQFQKSSKMLDIIQGAMHSRLIKNKGQEFFDSSMREWKEYFGEELFTKARKSWI